jgi:hypothetical protein
VSVYTNDAIDAFVLDVKHDTLARASVSDASVEGNLQSRSPIVSNNGRKVLFLSAADNLVPGDTNQAFDSFVRDLRRGVTRRVSVASDGSEGNHGSSRGTFGRTASYVAFGSSASNFAPGDTNAAADVFVRDLKRGTTVRATSAHGGGDNDVFAVGCCSAGPGYDQASGWGSLDLGATAAILIDSPQYHVAP